MPTKLTSTGVTFYDSSVQSTAIFGIGLSQTWTDMTSFRLRDVIYTNTTPRAIMVSIMCSAGNVTTDTQLYINGILVCKYYNNPNNTTISCTLVGIVPPGGTYYTTISANTTIDKWSELR